MAAVPREYSTYVVAWIGRNISFLDGSLVPGVPVSGVQVSTGLMLPRNAIITQYIVAITTGFNAATTNTLDIGTAANAVALTGGYSITAAQSTSNQPGQNGLLSSTADVEIFTRYNFTGAAPTAGLGRVVIYFVVDPDRRK